MKSNHYTHSLYYKLLIGYLIFGLLGFITIATISSEMTYHHLVERMTLRKRHWNGSSRTANWSMTRRQ